MEPPTDTVKPLSVDAPCVGHECKDDGDWTWILSNSEGVLLFLVAEGGIVSWEANDVCVARRPRRTKMPPQIGQTTSTRVSVVRGRETACLLKK